MSRPYLVVKYKKYNVNSNTGWQVLYVGGNWNNTGNAGLFYFNANNTSSNTNTNRGARQITCMETLRPGFPSPLGENQFPVWGLVGYFGFSTSLRDK